MFRVRMPSAAFEGRPRLRAAAGSYPSFPIASFTAATASSDPHGWLLMIRQAVAYETLAACATRTIDMKNNMADGREMFN